MSRLTLRLLETLHQHLIKLAETEGVSLNQYIVYALTRQAVSTEFIQATPEKEIIEQEQSFNTLLPSTPLSALHFVIREYFHNFIFYRSIKHIFYPSF
jgi:hypothetical protein